MPILQMKAGRNKGAPLEDPGELRRGTVRPVQGEREWVWMDRAEGLGTGHREASRGPAHLCQGQLPWLPG